MAKHYAMQLVTLLVSIILQLAQAKIFDVVTAADMRKVLLKEQSSAVELRLTGDPSVYVSN